MGGKSFKKIKNRVGPREKSRVSKKKKKRSRENPRWVIDIFSKSCFVLTYFMYVISQHDIV